MHGNSPRSTLAFLQQTTKEVCTHITNIHTMSMTPTHLHTHPGGFYKPGPADRRGQGQAIAAILNVFKDGKARFEEETPVSFAFKYGLPVVAFV